jgi:hypothetical protein
MCHGVYWSKQNFNLIRCDNEITTVVNTPSKINSISDPAAVTAAGISDRELLDELDEVMGVVKMEVVPRVV